MRYALRTSSRTARGLVGGCGAATSPGKTRWVQYHVALLLTTYYTQVQYHVAFSEARLGMMLVDNADGDEVVVAAFTEIGDGQPGPAELSGARLLTVAIGSHAF